MITNSKGAAHPIIQELLDQVTGGGRLIRLQGLQGSARSFFAAHLFHSLKRTEVIITADEKEATALHEDISFFLGQDNVRLYPARDSLLVDMFSQEREAELPRMEILYRLLNQEALVLIVSMQGLLQKTIPKGVYVENVDMFSRGQYLERDKLLYHLDLSGYSRVPLVEEKGQYAVRGNIIDLFPLIYERPVRLEFSGDELEAIRQFDQNSQRSAGNMEELVVTPVREIILTAGRRELALKNIRRRAGDLELPRKIRNQMIEALGNGLAGAVNPLYLPLFYEVIPSNEGELMDQATSLSDVSPRPPLGTLFDYLPRNSILIFDDPSSLCNRFEAWKYDMDRLLNKVRETGSFYLERSWSYLTFPELKDYCEDFQRLTLEGLSLGNRDALEGSDGSSITINTETLTGLKGCQEGKTREEGLFAPLAGKINVWLKEGNLVTFLYSGSEAGQRMAHLFKMYNLPTVDSRLSYLDDVMAHNGHGRLVLREGHLSRGFRLPGFKLVLLGEEEIFGKKVHRRKVRSAREGFFLQSFGDLKEGGFVVHTDHGIGIYRGLHKLKIADINNDFLLLEYQDNDKLYIPVDRLAVIQRYVGPDGYQPRLDKLGGPSWETTKERIKKSIREVAEELIGIYAAREVRERKAFSRPEGSYDELSATFEYEETPDQSKAIWDINQDMDRAKPMDRLICGDAGFGKTEVALRASFRAVMDGKQVVVMVPTTILAEQHYQTFTRRLKAFPVNVAALNRFRTRKEQQDILAGLERGTIDIIIGTHRLLQKDVIFKDLGLVVIDEEQRFGVAHKEQLKKLRTLVDVLALSATPIPRTLHLSLIGIRDLSIISTPPADRLPIKTYVLEFSEDQIREAIRRELERSGQVFFVHDRIHSIHAMAGLIQRLTPEARLGIVHGRMTTKEIEDVMGRFVRQECNVLVCTSIIGSGLDIPTANTIIVNRADRFGLAQLYQLRGRVGRAGEEALAYMMVPKGAMLSPEARRRLRAIMDFCEPGSGFKIAGNDLEIRGGGNILGTSQSGHVSAVGYELYVELMEKTVAEMKGEPVLEDEVKPEINLGIPAYIPEDYINDMQRRLVTYKKISLAKAPDDLTEIREELKDCYGAMPAEVENLLQVIEIRNQLQGLRAKKMGYDKRNMYIFFHSQSRINPEKIVELSRKRKGVRLTPDLQLYLAMPALERDEIVKEAKNLLHLLG